MNIITEFVSQYATTILYAILTAIAGALGVWFKKIYERRVNDKTKKEAAETCVKAVEQLYKDLHGEEKYDKCVTSLSELLTVKGITISEIEIKMLIEAAVAEFNKAFDKPQEVVADE